MPALRLYRSQIRSLDFIVIGAQKAGTTTLWHHLRGHPSIWMPPRKEEPFFCSAQSRRPGAFDEYMATHFGAADGEALLGKATPQYMMGSERLSVEEIAEQISTTLPGVRLIALLRDPIERAASHHRMSVRRGWESRSLEAALASQLEPAQSAIGREQPTETNSYVAQGEYGRVLRAYRRFLPAEQLHVEMTSNLDRDPAGVLDRALTFLSLPTGYRPPRLGARYHRGGTEALLDEESRASLLEFMQENVWPHLGNDSERVQRLFGAFLAIWDVTPETEPPQLSTTLRGQLERHYEADAEALTELEIASPWVDIWKGRDSGPRPQPV